MKRLSALLAMGLLLPASVYAQEPNTEAPQAPENEANRADEAPQAAQSNDPGDVIAKYFTTMGDIVAQNLDNPEALLEKFSAYIKENEKNMRKASKAFESKLSGMKSNEAEVYRETVQRKITPSLNSLISLLIDFSNRYPEQAKQLDSILKIDAKYTYQQ